MHSSNLEGTVVINGSFVTDKVTPNDIELTLDTRSLADALQYRAFKYFQAKHNFLQQNLKIDWYPTIDGYSKSDFVSFFQYVGVKTAAIKSIPVKSAKGILRLESW